MDAMSVDTGPEELQRRFPELMKVLDSKSKALFWHIWRNRHCRISELTRLIKAKTDLHTLSRLKEVINPQAERILGKKIVIFEESRIDQLTGEKILFSWWLNQECFATPEQDDELVDIFDEENNLRVVMRLPVEEKGLKIDVKQNRLLISNGDYHKEILLFYNVRKAVKKSCRNRILEVCLEKIK